MAGEIQTSRFKLRGFTSLLLMLSFALMVFSGAILYLTPHGWYARGTGWSMLGLDKWQWAAVHTNNSILFLLISVLHLWLNWRAMVSYIRQKATGGLNLKLEMALAALVAGVVLWGTIADAPPFNKIAQWNDRIKAYWIAQPQTPAAPGQHGAGQASPGRGYGEMTLEQFASAMNIPQASLIDALRNEGFDVPGQHVTIDQLARNNAVPRRELYAAIGRHFPDARLPGRGGGGGGGGR